MESSSNYKNMVKANVVPKPTLRRLASYLAVLEEYRNSDLEWFSCQMISARTEADPSLVRKDIAYTGIQGRQRKGYQLQELIAAIEKLIGWDNRTDAILVGVGNLGSAILGYKGFLKYGINVICGFDVDPAKVGKDIHEKPVFHIDVMKKVVERIGINLGIIACGIESAQSAADAMVAAGIHGIWNFTQAQLKLPAGVIVENVDLAASLATLSGRLATMQENGAEK